MNLLKSPRDIPDFLAVMLAHQHKHMVTSANNTPKMVTVTRTAQSGTPHGTQISRDLKNNVPSKTGLVCTVCAVAMAALEASHCLEGTANETGSSVLLICPPDGQFLLPDTGNVV